MMDNMVVDLLNGIIMDNFNDPVVLLECHDFIKSPGHAYDTS